MILDAATRTTARCINKGDVVAQHVVLPPDALCGGFVLGVVAQRNFYLAVFDFLNRFRIAEQQIGQQQIGFIPRAAAEVERCSARVFPVVARLHSPV